MSRPCIARPFGLLPLALVASTVCILPSGGSRAADASMCPSVRARSDYDKAWNKIVSERRIVVEASIRQLEALRSGLDGDYASTVGSPASGRDFANLALLMIREVTDVVRNVIEVVEHGPSIGFAPNMPQREHATRKILDVTDALRAAVEDPETKAFDRVLEVTGIMLEELRIKLDDLKSRVPGLKLAKSLDEIGDARSEYRRLTGIISKQMSVLKDKLRALDGPERKYSVDAILESARAEKKSCIVSAKAAPRGQEAMTPREPPQVRDEAETRTSPEGQRSGSTPPVQGACIILDTCNQ